MLLSTMSVSDEGAFPRANISEERARENVQGTPDLQEIYLYCVQELQSLRDELASIKESRDIEKGELQLIRNELASIKESRGITTRGVGRVAQSSSEHSCLCAPMEPALWSTLPNELLHQIFARLPLPQIIRLQCLSTEWEWNLTSEDSEFTRTCSEANPKIFAMVAEGHTYGSVSVRLYDIKANRWHSIVYPYHLYHVDTLCAGDGGLVCIVSTATNKKKTPLIITVFNPLTGQCRALPHQDLRKLQLQMVQLVMDRDTRCYKVIVVGEKKRRAGRSGDVVAKIYSSETGAWSSKFEGVLDLIFGHQYSWDHDLHGGGFAEDNFLEENRLGPCAYDCSGRQLLELLDVSHPCIDRIYVQFHHEASSQCYALVKDHLFVLHEETYEATNIMGNIYLCRRYCISEYQGQKCEPYWVKLKVHRCKEFERPPASVFYTMSLYACKGFLLVKAENDEGDAYRHVLTWLYDLSTAKWQAIPPFPDEVFYPSSDTMFELQWDAIP